MMTKADGIAVTESEATLQKSLKKDADLANRQYDKFQKFVVVNVIALGDTLLKIREKRPAGQWERLFAGHPSSIDDPIRFGIRYAQMFMAIAQDPIIRDEANHGSLPISPRTLYEITRLSAATKRRALTDGRIHPEMQQHDAVALGKSAQRRPTATMGPRSRVGAQREISDVLRRLWIKFPSERPHFLQEVKALAGVLPLRDDEVEDPLTDEVEKIEQEEENA